MCVRHNKTSLFILQFWEKMVDDLGIRTVGKLPFYYYGNVFYCSRRSNPYYYILAVLLPDQVTSHIYISVFPRRYL